MNSLRTLVAAVLLPVSLTANTAPNDGEKRFDVAGFGAIAVTGSDDVRVIAGDRFSVTATGDPRALAALEVDVRGDTLRVGRRGNWRDRGALVTIAMPAVRAVAVTGSGGVDVARVAVTDFTARVSGAGNLRIRALRTHNAQIEVNGSGDVAIDDAATDALTIGVSGSGDVAARGTAGSVAMRLTGSGDIDAAALDARRLRIDASGSGDVRAHARDTAAIAAGGASDVAVTGHPICTVRKGGAADVTCG